MNRAFALAVALYAVVVIVIRRHYGGDIVPEIFLSQRWIDGLPLYVPALSTEGTPWPPFAALLLAPLGLLARFSLPVAIAAWSAISVACLGLAVFLARRWGGWRTAALAFAATAVPIQTNFEHRNVNAILLLLVVAAAADLESGRDGRAGLWVGLAAAIKAFPALLIPYLALQQRWRAFGIATAIAGAGTLLALLPYGVTGALSNAGDWLQSSMAQNRWPVSVSDQSLRAVIMRIGGTPAVALGLAALCATVTLIYAGTRTRDALSGLGAVLLAALVAAPIAWVHYYTLAFPGWAALLRRWPIAFGRVRGALLLAGIATSGVLTIGPRSLRHGLLAVGVYVWGALVLLVVLGWLTRQPENVPDHG
jgi:alpha-1,2-mannosyltransferase